MKEATGEGAMTVVTIILIGSAIVLLVPIIATLINNQNKRSKCENSGYNWSNGKCTDGENECTLPKGSDEYTCPQ